MFFNKIPNDLKKLQNIIVEEIYVFHPVPCKLLDDFGLFIQVLLAIGSFSVLIAKRGLESPQRSWKIWFLDVSKQGITACSGHLLNLMISEKFSKDYMNQCNWYFISLITDVLLGTFLNIMTFKQIEIYLSDSNKYKFVSGDYGPNDSWKSWMYQCIIWLLTNYLVKFFLLLVLFMNVEFFSFLSSWVLGPFQINPRVELVYVMVLLPTLLNGFAFWLTDSYLKREETSGKSSETDSFFKNSEKKLRRMMTN